MQLPLGWNLIRLGLRPSEECQKKKDAPRLYRIGMNQESEFENGAPQECAGCPHASDESNFTKRQLNTKYFVPGSHSKLRTQSLEVIQRGNFPDFSLIPRRCRGEVDRL